MVGKFLKEKISVQGTEITVLSHKAAGDFISLIDIARYQNPLEPKDVVLNWMRLRNTIEYLGVWERLNNPNFKDEKFEIFLYEAGANAFTLSPKRWIDATGAVGIVLSSGKSGSVFAHKDIALKFASWVSAEFEMHIIKECQRVKANKKGNIHIPIDYNISGILAKVDHKEHTKALYEGTTKPEPAEKKQAPPVYTDEADILNTVLFGMTEAEWRRENPDIEGSIRDHATIEQKLVLVNLENTNALYISKGMSQSERIIKLSRLAALHLSAVIGASTTK